MFSIVYSKALFERISSALNSRMIILLCMLSFALAEPPVGDSYLDAAQLSNDKISHQQYLPPDLTVPSARTSKSFTGFSNQHLAPSTRSISQKYGPPDARTSLSQEYGLPTRSASTFRSGISQNYGTPVTRSSQYDLLNSDLNHSFSSALKSGVSQRYGTPSSRNSQSGLYHSLSQTSSPSLQYGTPEFRSSNQYTSHPSPVQKYGVPSFESTQTISKFISQEYGTPSNTNLQQSSGLFGSNSFSSRLQDTKLKNIGNPSQSYRTPASSLSSQYGTPLARNSASRFGESASSININTNAFGSSYPSARSPFLEYGAPSSRTSVPSQEYGVPEGSIDDQDNEYTKNALEILSQKPAYYQFAYKVSDDFTASDFGHSESRQLDRAEGAYFVLLPDGTKQVVEDEADGDGFKPRISVELVDSLEAEGPY